jgi:hypothetical protein
MFFYNVGDIYQRSFRFVDFDIFWRDGGWIHNTTFYIVCIAYNITSDLKEVSLADRPKVVLQKLGSFGRVNLRSIQGEYQFSSMAGVGSVRPSEGYFNSRARLVLRHLVLDCDHFFVQIDAWSDAMGRQKEEWGRRGGLKSEEMK